MKNDKIVNFNDYCLEEDISNLKVYSKKKRRYRLLKRLIPYIAVGSFTLGVAHFLGGLSFKDGNIIKCSSYDYGKDEDFADMNGESYFNYYSSWVKEDGGYSRDVSYYDASYFNEEDILDIVKNNNTSILDDYYISTKREHVNNVSVKEKLFNYPSMQYISFKNNGSYIVANVGVAGVVDYALFYIVFQPFGVYFYKKCFDFEDDYKDDKVVHFSKCRKK